MSTVANKAQILDDAGYAYSVEREIYVNRDVRKVFSVEFIEDRDEAELEAAISAPPPPAGEWLFYFITEPSEAVKRDLYIALGNGRKNR